MKTATVELEAGGVRCHGQFVNLDLRWFLVLVVESWELARSGIQRVFCERRKCDGAPPAVHSGARRCQLHLRGALTTEKRFGGRKKGARPLSCIFQCQRAWVGPQHAQKAKFLNLQFEDRGKIKLTITFSGNIVELNLKKARIWILPFKIARIRILPFDFIPSAVRRFAVPLLFYLLVL
jgi:hypothetical protein